MAKPKDKASNLNLPWVEKYRPETLDDLISHEEIINTIKTFIAKDRLPHLLFYGPPGTGKTSTILACARQLYTDKEFSTLVLEFNASDDRGIGIVRGPILEFASSRTIFKSKQKLIILDEADMMTNDAQNALRRIIEKYTSNVRFCIICNYLGKVIPALQSRCTRFRFGPLKPAQIIPRLELVLKAENVKVTSEGKEALMKLGEGDMRKVLNILQSTALAFSNFTDEGDVEMNGKTALTPEHFYLCTGFPMPQDIELIVNCMLSSDVSTAYKDIRNLQNVKGLALVDIATQVHKYIERIDFPPKVRIYLLKEIADLEHRLALGTSEKLQLGSLISTFFNARSLVEQEA